MAVATLLCSSLAVGQKNVVFLFSDDAGYADMGFQNPLTGATTEFKTPNLDALASQGTVFSQGYVSGPVCSPSRAGLLTGQYQNRFGYEYNIENSNTANDGMPTSQTLMFEKFKQLGYTTGVVGKWHIGRERAKQPRSQGVDEFFGLWSGSRPYFGNESTVVKAIRRESGVNDTTTPLNGTGSGNWLTETSFNNIPNDSSNRGRHVTDAFGDEASSFIANHAGDTDPFLLYVPFTAPHGPLSASKAQDFGEFAGTSLTGDRRRAAALTFAMDRAIGHVLDRLEDPNGDGDTSDSVADDTLVVFANDNGGPEGSDHDNGPLRGGKGNVYEGGIRVPMIMRAPNPDYDPSDPSSERFLSGQFDSPITTRDFLPTFVAAAGGTVSPGDYDGVDLLPYLTGQNTNAPHETLVWRRGARYAVRQGDWKLVDNTGSDPLLVELNANGSGEFVDRTSENPAMRAELERKLTDWEVQMAKPTQSTNRPENRFDHFTWRATNTNWAASDAWAQDGPGGSSETMEGDDAFANAVLEFRTSDSSSYTSNNNLTRMTGYDFMLNQIQLNGDFQGTASQSGTIQGNDLLFVNDLDGNAPEIQLAASGTSSTDHTFAFNIDTNLVLYNSLTISGNSDGEYNFNGTIGGYESEFYDARNVTKAGSSTIRINGNVAIEGTMDIQAGTVEWNDEQMAGSVAVRSTATLNLSGDGFGRTTPSGTAPTHLAVDGDFLIESGGTLRLDIGDNSLNDRLAVAGDATWGGTLDVRSVAASDFILGDSFDLLDFSSSNGTFADVLLPNVAEGLVWDVSDLYSDGTITVADAATIPEPNGHLLALLSMIGFSAIMRRRTRLLAAIDV